MTIRSNVNIREINKDYGLFLTGVENAPEGLFQQGMRITEIIGDIADDLIQSARRNNLAICNSDGIREIEAMVFDLIRKQNPLSEIEGCMGLGRTLEDHPESRNRVIAGLIRDRDFVQSMRDASLMGQP